LVELTLSTSTALSTGSLKGLIKDFIESFQLEAVLLLEFSREEASILALLLLIQGMKRKRGTMAPFKFM
jgi:hypothetical protein